MESVESISSEVVKEHRSNFWNMLIPQGFFFVVVCLFSKKIVEQSWLLSVMFDLGFQGV